MTKIVGRTKEDVSTLPRWARLRIESLTRDLEEHQAHARASATPEKTNVFITSFDHATNIGLPKDSHVCFRLDGTGASANVVEVSHRGGDLEIRARDGALIVLPQISNVIHVQVSHR